MNRIETPSHDELNQLFALACDDQQNGRLESAQKIYQKLLVHFSEAPILQYNLGLVYYEQEDFQNGRDCFQRASELAPEDLDILFNLGLSQKNTGDLEMAIGTYSTILEKDPENIDTLYNLAGCYKDSLNDNKAVETYLHVLQLAPKHQSATNNIAYVYHRLGDTEKAIYYYQQVLDLQPGHPAAQHMLRSLTGESSCSSPDSYVKDVFDNYSDNYDQSLVGELEYCVPETIRLILDEKLSFSTEFEYGLDLGCGTGLSGEAFRDKVKVMDGIDLSDKMIALACQKDIYRKLEAVNIVDYLTATADCYDFLLAADVFAYVGDLVETFTLLRKKSLAQVLFCFSTESSSESGYILQKSGRFAHSSSYVNEVAKETGWQVLLRQGAPLRKERGSWVQGNLWFLQLA